jgi:GNAT superfamily N-acetyltransferase
MTLRIAQPEADFPRIAELLSLVTTEPVTVSGLWDDENRMMPGKIRRRWVNDDAGRINGYAMIIKYPSEPIDLFHIELVVDPAARRGGIGAGLCDTALAFAAENGCGRLMTEIQDNDPDSLAFGQRRGFVVSHHVFDSELKLAAFDETPFAGVIERLEAEGIRFITLAEAGATEEAERGVYEANRAAVLDEPGSVGTFPTYENWRRIILESGWYRRESQFIAVDGRKYIGLAGVYNEVETPETMFNGLTGVDRDYRGRKIALALKLLTIHYAREHGAKVVTTNNDARNAPMLAINRKLGYQPLPGHYVVVKNMDQAASGGST